MKKLMKYVGLTTIALTAIGVAVRAMRENKIIFIHQNGSKTTIDSKGITSQWKQ